MRENLYARRAADKVKGDLDSDKPVARLTADERAAVEPLAAHAAPPDARPRPGRRQLGPGPQVG